MVVSKPFELDLRLILLLCALNSNLLREYKLIYIFHHTARALHRRQKILKQPVHAQFTLIVEDIQIVGPLFVFIHFLC